MRNFNIFIFKTNKRIDSPNIIEQSESDIAIERNAIRKEFMKFVDNLKTATDDEDYNTKYNKGLTKIAGYYNFPEQKLKNIGYDISFRNKNKQVNITPVPVETVEANVEPILLDTFNKIEGELENMDFAYQLWRQKFIEGNGTIWLTKNDLEEGIRLATNAIGDKYHPEHYLPQEDGEYGNAYVKQVRQFRNTCKHLLNLMKKKYEIYAIIFQKNRGK